MDPQELFIKGKENNSLIVSFGGYDGNINGIIPFEFLKFLDTHFKNEDKLFYKDSYFSSYHKGIKGISKNITETYEYLKTKINKYHRVLFLGVSGGGYAAILFGSLLNITNVLAFIPQTILYKPDKEQKYKNLKPFINSVTRYYIYGATGIKNPTDCHHIHQCENINCFPNVSILKKEHIVLKRLRDSGELFEIINNIILK